MPAGAAAMAKKMCTSMYGCSKQLNVDVAGLCEETENPEADKEHTNFALF